MKKICVIVFSTLMAVSAFANARDWKEIRFGVDASYAPFEFKAPSGRVVGFDIDLGEEICRRLSAKCVWIENDFDGMIPALKAKKFDGVLSSMSITESRMKEISFSARLFNDPTRMVTRKGSGLLPTVASLKGKRVGVEQGTNQESYAKVRWAPAGVEIVPYQNQNLVLSDLVSGRLDASLQDAVQAEYGFLKTAAGKDFQFAGQELVDNKLLGSGAGIGMRKEDVELKAAFDKAIAGMLKDGTYKKIANKYFSFDIYGK